MKRNLKLMSIEEFIYKNYDKAINLKKGFKKTENKPWNAIIVLCELYVQIGHITCIEEGNDKTLEINRKINDLGDEISDVFLQLFVLTWKLNINIKECFIYNYCGDTVGDLSTIVGQITEIIMEENGFRHKKNREGFATLRDFLNYKINCAFSIMYDFAKKKGINIDMVFNKMVEDASKFLKDFERS